MVVAARAAGVSMVVLIFEFLWLFGLGKEEERRNAGSIERGREVEKRVFLGGKSRVGRKWEGNHSHYTYTHLDHGQKQ